MDLTRHHRAEAVLTFSDCYTLGNLLGSGGFASVYEGVRKSDGRQVAVKILSKMGTDIYINIPGESSKFHIEVALMKLVSKPPQCQNVIQLLDWFETPQHILLVLERPDPCMDVLDFLMSQGGILDESLAKTIMCQVIEAACHCHQRGVFHRDIKMENLLLNTVTKDVKLIDFGCGDLWRETPYSCFAGTALFCPPEYCEKNEYHAYPATVWSLGVTLFVMVTGEMPFETKEDIVAGTLTFPAELSQACCHLIRRCLEQDPDQRPSFRDIKEHEWFTGRPKQTSDKLTTEDLHDQLLPHDPTTIPTLPAPPLSIARKKEDLDQQKDTDKCLIKKDRHPAYRLKILVDHNYCRCPHLSPYSQAWLNQKAKRRIRRRRRRSAAKI